MENLKLAVFDAGNVIFEEKSGGMMGVLKESCNPEMFSFLQSNLLLGAIELNEDNLQQYGLQDTKFAEQFHEISQFESHLEMMPPIQETIDVINQLHKAGVIVGVLSNATIWMERYVEQLVMAERKIFSCKYHMMKPDLRFFRFAFDGYRPHEIVYVDDKAKNVIAAKQTGVRGILFDPQHPEQLRTFLGL